VWKLLGCWSLILETKSKQGKNKIPIALLSRKQEKTKHSSSRRRRATSDYIPEDVVLFNIIRRLPVKKIMQLTTAYKSWKYHIRKVWLR
jgi:hypothetical protein